MCALLTGVQTCALPLCLATIFAVADDRVADRRHMDAKLMRAAGERLKLDPRRAVAGAFDNPIARFRDQPLVVDVHLFAARSGLLGERQVDFALRDVGDRSEEHTSELQSLMRISYAVFCLKNKNKEQR